jgi:Tetracyclin repressor-like, C-terminal domain
VSERRQSIGVGRLRLRSSRTRCSTHGAGWFLPVFQRGIDRGDLDSDADVELATLLAIGPFSYLIEHRLPVPEDLAERIATRLAIAFAATTSGLPGVT